MRDNDVEIVLSHKDLNDSITKKRSQIDFQLKAGPSFDEHQNASRRSQALQSVMNQNEDLMARLKAAMFRANELENQIESQDLENRKLRKERDDLFEQALILKEKELIYRERTEKSLQRGEDLKEENRELHNRLQKVERAFRRLFKYREKIRVQIPNFKSLKTKNSRLSEINSHLKVQVEELTGRIQKIHTEMSESQAHLVADYETQIAELSKDLHELSQKAQERDHFKKSMVEFENKSIELEREMEHLKASYTKESYTLRSDVEQFRKQTKELLIQCETLKSQISEKTMSLNEEIEISGRLSDQVESLQILWKEKQEEVERVQEKNRALQKINQDMSTKLNEAKRENTQLKSKLEAEVELSHRIKLASTHLK